jgi:hypothetical protein
VSWLPQPLQYHNAAITAMAVADLVSADGGIGCPMICAGPEVDALAAELGLSGPHAVVRASEPPDGCQPSDVSGTTSAALCAPAGQDGRTHTGSRQAKRATASRRPACWSLRAWASCAPVSVKTQFWCRFTIQTRIVQSTRRRRIFRFSENRATTP